MDEQPGFIAIRRKLFQHWIWTGEERVYSRAEAWIDLIQMAAWREHKRMIGSRLVTVPLGGMVASERFLATRWKWSRNKLRLFLEQLTAENMLRRQEDHGQTILTLVNYRLYNSQGTTEGPPMDQTWTTEGPDVDQRRTSEGPKENKSNKSNKVNTSNNGNKELSGFDLFWKFYPRKEAKQAARKAWSKAVKRSGGPDAIQAAVELFATSDKGKGEFCPHATTWLNQGRYEDDPAEWNRKPQSEQNGGGALQRVLARLGEDE